MVDDFALPAPSSRGALSFGPSRNGARSTLRYHSGSFRRDALFAAADLRDGYLRADPGDPAAVLQAVLKARDLVGSFDKPRYIAFDEHLCAHSRSQITGCTRCLDLCPTGAIAPAGDHVAIDAYVCAGCGQCAAVCPTGAASYALPPADALMRKLRAMLTAYREAGGEPAIVLLHDEPHGTPLIDALARFGDGLPAHVLPLCRQRDHADRPGEPRRGLRLSAPRPCGSFSAAQPRHDVTGIDADDRAGGTHPGRARLRRPAGSRPSRRTIRISWARRCGRSRRWPPAPRPASFLPEGGKRSVLRFALRELHRAAPVPVDRVALPEGAPFGAVEIDVAGCTLCLSCVSACPTGALSDDPERPMLRFAEDACVQCGLCRATCPEKVITLKPQLDFRAATASARILKEEEPFCCIRCGKPFGVKSMIERVTSQLQGRHWMYKDKPARLDLIKMCDDCRVVVVTEQEFDPHGAPERSMRTTEDYLRDRAELQARQKDGR